jgi:hypothetical protein
MTLNPSFCKGDYKNCSIKICTVIVLGGVGRGVWEGGWGGGAPLLCATFADSWICPLGWGVDF